MPKLAQLIVVGGRLTHHWDFTFYKNNGEIANRVRTELGASLKEIRLDADGDIEIQTEAGSFFVTPVGIVACDWLTDSISLLEPKSTEAFSRMFESLAKIKGSFQELSYSVRLFLRFTPADSLKLVGGRGFDAALASLAVNRPPNSNL